MFGEAAHREQLFHDPIVIGCCEKTCIGFDPPPGQQCGFLKYETDLSFRPSHFSTCWRNEAGNDPKQRGLAAPAWSDDGNDFAGTQLEGNVTEYHGTIEVVVNAAEAGNRGGGHCHCPRE
jgi:hypothetical protein